MAPQIISTLTTSTKATTPSQNNTASIPARLTTMILARIVAALQMGHASPPSKPQSTVPSINSKPCPAATAHFFNIPPQMAAWGNSIRPITSNGTLIEQLVPTLIQKTIIIIPSIPIIHHRIHICILPRHRWDQPNANIAGMPMPRSVLVTYRKNIMIV